MKCHAAGALSGFGLTSENCEINNNSNINNNNNNNNGEVPFYALKSEMRNEGKISLVRFSALDGG